MSADDASTGGDTPAEAAETLDAAPDAVPDAVRDAAPDATLDAQPDATPDAQPDATLDAQPDALPDATPDAALDATPDAARDAAPDVAPDRPDAMDAAPSPDVAPDRPDAMDVATVDRADAPAPDASPDAAPDASACARPCAEGSVCSGGACSAVVQTDGGEGHTCARLADGTVWCWGHDEFGQIGDGAAGRLVVRGRPTPVAGLSGIVEIAVGRNHACARRGDGTVACWGANESGQVGNGARAPAEPRAVTVVGLTGATDLAAGRSHSCAIVAGGAVRCWGSNALGQAGEGSATGSFPSPVAAAGIAGATSVAAGNFHTCVTLADGAARCWGSNSVGQLGAPVTGSSRTPVAVVGDVGRAQWVIAGALFTCVKSADGHMRCWGNNSAGQLGDGTTTARATPTLVQFMFNATAADAGDNHVCASTDGGLFCWGTNRAGELGDGYLGLAFSPRPALVPGARYGTALGVGVGHTCARINDGALRCWGAADYGQLGTGAAGGYFEPQPVLGLTRVAQVVARDHHTCARLEDGTARCWGANGPGELGDGTSGVGRHFPAPVTGLTAVAELAAGSFHNCARLADGTGRCWGYNDRGQVGDASVVMRLAPVAVTALRTLTGLAAGQTSSCGLLADGTVQCWGANNNGRLGRGYEDMFSHDVPAGAVMRLSGAASLAMGLFHVCAVRTDATLMCWGANDRGQLGDGTTTARFVATAVPGLTNVTQVSGGYQHTCARRGDGTVWCWGLNNDGQCGQPAGTANVLTPTAVPGLTGVAEVAAGEFFTCARRGDGTVWCWGNNNTAQLGGGESFVARATPAAVPGLTNVAALAAGAGHVCARLGDGTLRCWGAVANGALGAGQLVAVRF